MCFIKSISSACEEVARWRMPLSVALEAFGIKKDASEYDDRVQVMLCTKHMEYAHDKGVQDKDIKKLPQRADLADYGVKL